MRLLRFLYTQNPFYLVSAVLVLLGLRSLFPSAESAAYAWMLVASLAAYTSLLALTAYGIVRLGGVWEDARSILLVVVFLMLALSMSCEETLIPNPGLGCALLVGGLAISLVISESLLRGLKIRLPSLLRLPFYLLLAEFFLYPMFLTALLHNSGRSALQWGVFGFGACLGISLLTLLPAVRRGKEYAEPSGTPWPWPWFPWSPFVVLVLGAGVRTYSFGLSFGLEPAGVSFFAPYFLAPIVLVVSLLLLEVGLVEKQRWLQRLAVGIPLAILLLAFVEPTPTYGYLKFLDRLLETGSPPFLTLLTVGLIHGYGWLRRASGAELALVVTLLLLAVVGRGTVDLATLMSPRATPILAVAAVELVVAFRRPSSWRFFLASCALVGGLGVALEGWGALRFYGVLPAHLVVAASLIIGRVFEDPCARFFQGLGMASVSGLGLLAITFGERMVPGVTEWMLASYLATLVAVQLGYWYLTRNLLHLSAAALTSALCLWAIALQVYQHLREFSWPRGLGVMLAGFAFFLAAVGISVVKIVVRRRAGETQASQR